MKQNFFNNRLYKKRLAWLLGYIAEWLVVVILKLKLYKILKRRYLTRYGEIDIIARRGNNLLFVEVKARGSKESLPFAINNAKIKKILTVAEQFLQVNPHFTDYTLRLHIYLVNFPFWQIVKIY